MTASRPEPKISPRAFQILKGIVLLFGVLTLPASVFRVQHVLTFSSPWRELALLGLFCAFVFDLFVLYWAATAKRETFSFVEFGLLATVRLSAVIAISLFVDAPTYVPIVRSAMIANIAASGSDNGGSAFISREYLREWMHFKTDRTSIWKKEPDREREAYLQDYLDRVDYGLPLVRDTASCVSFRKRSSDVGLSQYPLLAGQASRWNAACAAIERHTTEAARQYLQFGALADTVTPHKAALRYATFDGATATYPALMAAIREHPTDAEKRQIAVACIHYRPLAGTGTFEQAARNWHAAVLPLCLHR